MRHFFRLGGLGVALVLALGCSRKTAQTSPDRAAAAADQPAVSTVSNPVKGRVRPAARVGTPRRRVDWRESDNDAGVGDGAPQRGEAAASAPAADAATGPSPEQLARAQTESAVDSALKQHNTQLRSCFDRAKSSAVETKVRFRVHRSGYVMTPQVDVADERIRTCVTGVLNRLRVDGVKTDTIQVERSFRFNVGQR